MARHASAERQRRLAAWPIILAVVVVVLGGLIAAYFIVVNSSDKTAACTGSTVLPVTASPGAGRAVGRAAAAFDATKPVARSTCVSVSVTTMPGPAAEAALAGGWKGQSTPAPGLWVVDSAADLAALDRSSSAMTAGHANADLATSPVVLAVRTAPPAGTVSWKSLAAGTAGGPRLTIPDPAANRASGYALESLVAASSGDGSAKPLDAAAVEASAPALRRLAAAATAPPATTSAALTELSAGQGGFTAVPVVESELAEFNRSHEAGLTAVYPTGPTSGDDVLAIPLTASWVTDAMSDAAAAFDAYLGDAEGIGILAAADLRTTGTRATAPGIDEKTAVTALPDATVAVRKSLELAWAAALGSVPAGGTATTTQLASDPPASSAVPSSGSTSTPAPATTPGSRAPSTTMSSPPTTSGSTTSSSTTSGPTTVSSSAAHGSAITAPAAVTAARPAKQGPAITLVLDTSGSMKTVDGGLQRITWMQQSVDAVIGSSPTDLFGLWTFSTQDGSPGYDNPVPLGALTDQLAGNTRAAAITSAVGGLIPKGDSWIYGAIRAAYADAVGSAVEGRANKMIVLTDGADTTPALSRTSLETSVSQLAGQHKNVELDIIGLSSSVNAEALTEIALAGGGRFTSLGDLTGLQSTLLGLCSGP